MTRNDCRYRDSNHHFNSHAHVERDHFASGLTNEQLNFNSHAHVERDSRLTAIDELKDNFNSHAHVERDFNAAEVNGESTDNFNSHAHVERDFIWVCRTLTIGISTHTLTWSVTLVAIACKPCASFQLTRSRGA